MVKSLFFFGTFILSQGLLQNVHSVDYKKMYSKQMEAICEYPFKLQENGIETFIGIEYKTNKIGYAIKRRIVQCGDKRFTKVALAAFDKMKHTRIGIDEKTDTIYLQYKINGSTTSINPQADVLIIGYSDSNVRVLTN